MPTRERKERKAQHKVHGPRPGWSPSKEDVLLLLQAFGYPTAAPKVPYKEPMLNGE